VPAQHWSGDSEQTAECYEATQPCSGSPAFSLMAPPEALPDCFAVQVKAKTWAGITGTLAGIAMVLYMISASIASFVSHATTTDSQLVPSLGVAYSLVVRCSSPMGCWVHHNYRSAKCRAAAEKLAAEAHAPFNMPAATPLQHGRMAPGEIRMVFLCGSTSWGDGVSVAAPMEPNMPVPRVEYLLDGEVFGRLPYAITATVQESGACVSISNTVADSWCESNCNHDIPNCPPDLCSCGEMSTDPVAATSVVMSRILLQDTTKGVNETWYLADGGASSTTSCSIGGYPPTPPAPPPASPPPGGKGGGEEDDDVNEDEEEEQATTEGALCYLLRIEPLVTQLVVSSTIDVIQLLDDWGGAYGLVFGVLAALYAVGSRLVQTLSARCTGGEGPVEASEQRRLSHAHHAHHAHHDAVELSFPAHVPARALPVAMPVSPVRPSSASV